MKEEDTRQLFPVKWEIPIVKNKYWSGYMYHRRAALLDRRRIQRKRLFVPAETGRRAGPLQHLNLLTT
jgi:hypothetical protein